MVLAIRYISYASKCNMGSQDQEIPLGLSFPSLLWAMATNITPKPAWRVQGVPLVGIYPCICSLEGCQAKLIKFFAISC